MLSHQIKMRHSIITMYFWTQHEQNTLNIKIYSFILYSLHARKEYLHRPFSQNDFFIKINKRVPSTYVKLAVHKTVMYVDKYVMICFFFTIFLGPI